MTNTCLCGSTLNYSECCKPFHDGTQIPKTAESLMRSRYSAYVLKDATYLRSTWHKSTRPNDIDLSNDNLTWQRLEILSTKKGTVNDDKGRVEFNAYYLQDNTTQLMHEISRFKKLSGRWYYVDGKLD